MVRNGKTPPGPETPPKLRFWITALTLVIVVVVDRITKEAALEHLRPVGSIPIIEGFFSLTYVKNTGGAFGMGQGRSPILFLILSVVCILLVSYFMLQEFRRGHGLRVPVLIGWGGILGGAVGNVWDRIAYGGFVVDFLDVYIGQRHWPAFNVADSAICVGVALMIVFLSPAKQAEAPASSPTSVPSSVPSEAAKSAAKSAAASSEQSASSATPDPKQDS